MPKVSLKTIKETELNKPKKHGRPQKALVVKDTTPPAIKNNKELDKNREKITAKTVIPITK